MKRAWHFLKDDWCSLEGEEPTWEVGEKRVLRDWPIELCVYGYHYTEYAWQATSYAPGNVLCEVEVCNGPVDHTGKGVSRSRKLIRGRNVSKELRQFAIAAVRSVLTPRMDTEDGLFAKIVDLAEQRGYVMASQLGQPFRSQVDRACDIVWGEDLYSRPEKFHILLAAIDTLIAPAIDAALAADRIVSTEWRDKMFKEMVEDKI